MTTYGIIFPQTPPLKHSDIDTSLLWTVSNLLCRVEKLWMIVEKVDLFTSKWHGWMLVFLTKNCFNQGNHRQVKNDPFKYKFISETSRFLEKIRLRHIEDFFIDFESVKLYNSNNSINL